MLPGLRHDIDAPHDHELLVDEPAVLARTFGHERDSDADRGGASGPLRGYPCGAAGSRGCPGRWRIVEMTARVARRVTAPDVAARKAEGGNTSPLVMVTAYDAPS